MMFWRKMQGTHPDALSILSFRLQCCASVLKMKIWISCTVGAIFCIFAFYPLCERLNIPLQYNICVLRWVHLIEIDFIYNKTDSIMMLAARGVMQSISQRLIFTPNQVMSTTSDYL